jgi:hypothetical protein
MNPDFFRNGIFAAKSLLRGYPLSCMDVQFHTISILSVKNVPNFYLKSNHYSNLMNYF